MSSTDTQNASSSKENESSQREKELLAIRLQRAIREKKISEAKKLLEEKPDIHYKDKIGCQCLHYAAQEGLLEIVKLLLEAGAHVNCFDHNGQSPLHKASSRGHLDVVINLVANGAQVASLDWDNHTPFEKAVLSRSVDVVEWLLTFGAEPNLQDWTWVMDMKEKEKKIQELITNHIPLVPGYKYEGIKFEVVYVKPNEDCVMEKLKLTLKAMDARNPFIVFCRKMQSEYTELKSLLHDEQIPYSDMFEIRQWGATRKNITLSLLVEGVPKCNEHLSVVSPHGQIGRVDNFVKNEEENTTEVIITIKMNTKGSTQFAIVSVFKKETFAISKEEVVIQPTSEPEAEIEIPKGTFDKAAELQLNVVDTKDVNEDEVDETGPLLMTNVIDMSMSDGQQPKEEIVMKLPIHQKGGEEEEMCVLATSEEYPDDADDWEIIEAQKDPKGKAAVFRIKHFSIYAGASKKKALEEKQEVVEAISRSIRKERKVEFRVYTRLEQERGKFQFILECWTPKKLKKSKSKWESEGCEIVNGPEGTYIIEENQTFKLLFKGNCRKISSETSKDKEDEDEDEDGDENDKRENDNEGDDSVAMDFIGKKGYAYTIVDMIVLNTNKPNGQVTIEKEHRTIEKVEEIKIVPGGLCGAKEQKEIVDKVKFEFEKLIDFPLGVKLPPPPKPLREPTSLQMESFIEEEKKLQEFIEKTDLEHPSFVPGMDMKNLSSIALQLSEEEARIFAKNLGMSNESIETYMDMPFGAVCMIRHYRGKRPHFSQKYRIKDALLAIDRQDLVPLIIPPEEEKSAKSILPGEVMEEKTDIPSSSLHGEVMGKEDPAYPEQDPPQTNEIEKNETDVVEDEITAGDE
ncbi:uncharacterized protein LOC133194068 [Saccostrea echinata]|uniref:uncharacterized protein LOC133194068 n=1 Tax=Saccostrea echinata TaxID=191078 RepID=UPI002A7F11C7|nr:uncharacterized protein LOC133194068 [Saccostrea echinata]